MPRSSMPAHSIGVGRLPVAEHEHAPPTISVPMVCQVTSVVSLVPRSSRPRMMVRAKRTLPISA